MSDYRGDDGTNTASHGARSVISHRIGEAADDVVEWESFQSSNRVSARWIFQREVRRRFQGALQLVDLALPKFDATVALGSNAHAHIAQVAEQVVDAYLENVYLVQNRPDPYLVGPALIRPDELVPYENAVHAGYDGLNTLERLFADALDAQGFPWFRNPSRSGYGIPLISLGTTSKFYPDFIVWRDHVVLAIDTKGGHLLQDAAARKLLRIEPPAGAPSGEAPTRLIVRFVSEGRWTTDIEQTGRDGFTVWGLAQDGKRRATHVDDIDAALAKALDPDPA